MLQKFPNLPVVFVAVLLFLTGQSPAQNVGVPVSYQLPATGPLPQTYRVTLAIVDEKNPAWIISQFVYSAKPPAAKAQ
jgi:hypothetical protein